MLKICIFSNYNQYDSKRVFAKDFKEALESLGVTVKLIDREELDLTAKEKKEFLQEIESFQPDYFLSFHSQVPLFKNTYFWDLLNTPMISILVDPAIYSLNLFESPLSFATVVDEEEASELALYFPNRTAFLPHISSPAIFPTTPQKKEIDLLFLGSFYDFESIRTSWKGRFSVEQRELLEESALLFFKEKTLSLGKTLKYIATEKNISLTPSEFKDLFYELDHYTRGKDRFDLISSIEDHQIHIFGEAYKDHPASKKGWKEALDKKKNIILHPCLPFYETGKIIASSKILLNSSPFFRHGSHERILNGLLGEAFVLTSESTWVKNSFSEKEGVYMYSKDTKEINTTLHKILSLKSSPFEGPSLGRKKVLKEYSPLAFARNFLNQLSFLDPLKDFQASFRENV